MGIALQTALGIVDVSVFVGHWRIAMFALALVACLLAALGQASGQPPKIASDVTAIDVLLAPDDVMTETRGTGILHHVFDGWERWHGDGA